MRVFLHAYVCEQGHVRWSNAIGLQEFAAVYLHRPTNCRYAVVSSADSAEAYTDYQVYDLYRAAVIGENDPPRFVVNPTEPRTYPSLEAALMATALTYK